MSHKTVFPRQISAAADPRVNVSQVEAKYPALLFKQQLDAFVQKIFPMLRDNVKKEITPQLAACIHAPRTATTRGRRTRDLGHSLSGEAPGTPGAPHPSLKPAQSKSNHCLLLSGWTSVAPASLYVSDVS